MTNSTWSDAAKAMRLNYGMMSKTRGVSMADIARHLNISQATVSYVLSGRTSGTISKRTRERVMAAAQELGYSPNLAAQILAGGGPRIVELCIIEFFPSYYAQVLDAFNLELYPTPYELHIVNPTVHGEGEWTSPKGVWPVDGIIADVQLSKSLLASLMQRGTPFVSIGPYANTKVDHVRVDLVPAAQEGLRHLVSHSRRVAFVTMPSPSTDPSDQWERYKVYAQVMKEAGLTEEVITPSWTQGTSIRVSTRGAVRDYIRERGCPDAFFCFNDERAIGTLAALRDLNLRVPQDAKILGCDGIEETEYHSPSISTIQYPFKDVARISWQFLQNRIMNPDVPLQSVTLTPQFIRRESTGF